MLQKAAKMRLFAFKLSIAPHPLRFRLGFAPLTEILLVCHR